MEKNTVQLPRHTLMLDGRARAKLTGVTAVSCFNDREVVLENGQLDVTGEIVGVEYSEATQRKARRGLFGRKKG